MCWATTDWVVVVTGLTRDGVPSGMTVVVHGAVPDPPLVAFMVARTSDSWASLQPLGSFCINVLGTHQEHVGRLVAGRKQNKLDDVDWRPGKREAPRSSPAASPPSNASSIASSTAVTTRSSSGTPTPSPPTTRRAAGLPAGGYGHFRPGLDDRAANSS